MLLFIAELNSKLDAHVESIELQLLANIDAKLEQLLAQDSPQYAGDFRVEAHSVSESLQSQDHRDEKLIQLVEGVDAKLEAHIYSVDAKAHSAPATFELQGHLDAKLLQLLEGVDAKLEAHISNVDAKLELLLTPISNPSVEPREDRNERSMLPSNGQHHRPEAKLLEQASNSGALTPLLPPLAPSAAQGYWEGRQIAMVDATLEQILSPSRWRSGRQAGEVYRGATLPPHGSGEDRRDHTDPGHHYGSSLLDLQGRMAKLKASPRKLRESDAGT